MTLVETTGTVAELQSEIDALQRRLDALVAAEQQTATPAPTGLIIPNIPPTVASGQIIASTWGNGVVSALTALDNDLGARLRVRAARFSVNTNSSGQFSIANANASPYRPVLGLLLDIDRPLKTWYWNLTPRSVPTIGVEMSPNGLNIEGAVFLVRESGGWVPAGTATMTGWYILITEP